MARLLTYKNRELIVLDPSVNIEVDPLPLKLATLNIGKKVDENRVLSYVFSNRKLKITSTEIEELRKMGRVSSEFIWKDNRLYRLETTLSQLHLYASRGGMITEKNKEVDITTAGFGALFDNKDSPLHPLGCLSFKPGAWGR